MARPHKPPPESESRHRGGGRTRKTPAPLTQGLTKLPGAPAQPAGLEPNPTERATEPSGYITQPTHGAGARPSKTRGPAATRLTTPNANKCVHQPREGRRRNRQTPPQKKRAGAGDRPTATKAPTHTTRGGQTSHQTAPKTEPPKGTPVDHPAKTGDTQQRAAAQRRK